MANRKAKARRRALAQREAREHRRELDRESANRRAKTSAAREARQARSAPRIARHDAAVLPLIREMREARATWTEIAAWLTDKTVTPPGGAGAWSAMAVWRIAQRGGLGGRLTPAGPDPDAAPVDLEDGRRRMPDGRIVFPRSRPWRVEQLDQLVLPTIRRMRARGASWREIAEHLEAEDVISPGRNIAHIRARSWTAAGVWRIGKRHGILGGG